MLNYSQARLVRLAATWTGNKPLNEGISIPQQPLIQADEAVEQFLLNAFFKSFEKEEAFYYFHHDEDISHNVVYQSCMQIFDNPDTLSDVAATLTQRLYDYSTMPKWKGGEFLIAVFDDVVLQDTTMPVIGLLKVVQKEAYLKVNRPAEQFQLRLSEGIGGQKLALAALIFGTDEAEGYRVMATDTLHKKDENSIWLSQFLEVKPIEDHYFNTRHYIQMASTFIAEKAPHKFGLNRTDTIDLMNKSAFYFKENEQFEIDNFAETLFETPEQQAVFKEFKEEYAQMSDAPLADQFDISKQAVRKSSKVFKRVIKLDDNFQIYVNGRRDLIERGFDPEKGKPFYKVYFDSES